MDGNAYREALIELGVTQAAFGLWVGVHPVTAKTWARRGPPPPVAKWVEFLLAYRKRTIPRAQLERLRAVTKAEDWQENLDLGSVRQLIGELEGLRLAMGPEPISWRPHVASPTVQPLPRRMPM